MSGVDGAWSEVCSDVRGGLTRETRDETDGGSRSYHQQQTPREPRQTGGRRAAVRHRANYTTGEIYGENGQSVDARKGREGREGEREGTEDALSEREQRHQRSDNQPHNKDRERERERELGLIGTFFAQTGTQTQTQTQQTP